MADGITSTKQTIGGIDTGAEQGQAPVRGSRASWLGTAQGDLRPIIEQGKEAGQPAQGQEPAAQKSREQETADFIAKYGAAVAKGAQLAAAESRASETTRATFEANKAKLAELPGRQAEFAGEPLVHSHTMHSAQGQLGLYNGGMDQVRKSQDRNLYRPVSATFNALENVPGNISAGAGKVAGVAKAGGGKFSELMKAGKAKLTGAIDKAINPDAHRLDTASAKEQGGPAKFAKTEPGAFNQAPQGQAPAPTKRENVTAHDGPSRTLIVAPQGYGRLKLDQGLTSKEFAAADAAGYREILHVGADGRKTRLDVQEGHAKAQGKDAVGLYHLRERVSHTAIPENHAKNGGEIFAERLKMHEAERGPKDAGAGEPGRDLTLKGLTHEPRIAGEKYKMLSAQGYDRVGLEDGSKQDVQLEAAKYEIHCKHGQGKNEVERVERAEMVQAKTSELKVQDLKGGQPKEHGENAREALHLNTRSMAPEQMAKIEASGQRVFSGKDIAKATTEQDNSKTLDKADMGRTK